ncbi:MAG: hypothetical protein VCA38_15140 [Roseibacillus sp.]|jgi:hypothetical protein
MKQSVFVPVLALTAGAAFCLGWITRPDSSNDNNSAASTDNGKRSGASVRPSSRPSSYSSGKSGARPVEEFVARFAIGGEISSQDMTAAIEAMRKENDPILRRKLFTALLDQLTPENAKAAYLAMQGGRRGGFGRGGSEDEARLLANAWGRIDGPGAVKALTEMRAEREAEREEGERGGRDRGRGGDMRGGIDLVSVLSGWATVDGSAAASYVNGIEDERGQRMAAYGVVRGLMVNGVDEAMGYIASMPKGEDGGRTQSFYMSTIASEMLEEGIDAAKNWVDTITDPDLKGGALSRVAESAIRDDLPSAVEWVTQYAGEESAARAVSRVASEWAEDDPQAVLTWADSLPDSAKAEAYGEAFEEWTRQDATAAGQYLTNMQPSPARDSAVEEFATTLARKEPTTAIQWAATIADPESRTQTLTRVARDWYFQDQAAATTWLETSGLPEESVKAVTAERERGGFDWRERGGGGGPGGGRGRGGR